MKVLLAVWVSIVMTFIGVNNTGDSSAKVTAVTTTTEVVHYSVPTTTTVYVKPDIFKELIGKEVPSFTHMLYVAWCESHQTWNDHGTYSGGFGFMHKSSKVYSDYSAKQSTWLQWGGAEFAKVPWKATSKEQALVWIRTYATGWTRPNGVFKPPTRPMKSLCHDDIPFGLRVFTGEEEWPVPDDWKPGDPPVKPWENN